ncbi:MAG: protein kinase [Victivallaceae bacterium]
MALILVADDSLVVRKSYENRLTFLGHKVISCENGQEAVTAFLKDSPDLLILDVDMPEMDGLEACREIRRHPGGVSVPIIIVSALDNEDDILNGLYAGANDYLIKPVKEAHLIAKLKTSLGISSLHKKDFELVKAKTLFAGRYQIENILGYGAHSVVFMVNDQQNNNEPCALKLLKESFDSKEMIDNFTREAQKVMSVDSPLIIKIYDFGTFSERIYLVMEYADGGDLLTILKRRRMNELECVLLGYDIIRAIRALRDKNIIHLDIKPANILVNKGQYKLTDFGMIVPRSEGTIPIDAVIWSTAAYISPEYLTTDAPISSKSDIYSLGVTLYEAITGGNPFESDRPAVGMFLQVNLIPPSLHDLDHNISTYFSDTVAAMLEKNPANRPSEEELEEVLKNLIEYNKSREIQHATTRAKRSKSEIKNAAEQLLAPIAKNECKKDSIADLPCADSSVEAIEQNIKKLDLFKNQAKRKQQVTPDSSNTFMERISNFKIKDIKTVFIVILLLGLMIVGGIVAYGIFFDDDIDKSILQGPLLSTVCIKCNFTVEKHMNDPAKEKCPKCGSPLAIALECHKCHKLFPKPAPPDEKSMSEAEYIAALEKPEKCPHCGSTNVSPKQVKVLSKP